MARGKKAKKRQERENNHSDNFNSDSEVCTPPNAPKKKSRFRALHFLDEEAGEECVIVRTENEDEDVDFEDLEVDSQTSMQSDGS